MVDPALPEAASVPADVRGRGVWQHAPLLPRTRHAVTLGEGGTPLIPLTAPRHLPGAAVHAKLETQNPTLSFKDRAMALAVSVALDAGLPGLVVASTGNAAVSASAYARAAGLACRVVCGRGSDAGGKLAACRRYGADVVEVDGDYSTAYAVAAEAERSGWLNVSTTYRNPLLAEAYRGIAVELHGQLGTVPALVVVPVGAGPLLRGIHQGFCDLVRLGLAAGVPPLVAVQAVECAPLAAAWPEPDWSAALRRGVTSGRTRATAIADPLRGYEAEGLLTLAAVRESGGTVCAVTEDDIRDGEEALLSRGIWVEPASATAWAALQLPEVVELTADGAPVVLVATGHGIKN